MEGSGVASFWDIRCTGRLFLGVSDVRDFSIVAGSAVPPGDTGDRALVETGLETVVFGESVAALLSPMLMRWWWTGVVLSRSDRDLLW